jgi:hypothetical protein
MSAIHPGTSEKPPWPSIDSSPRAIPGGHYFHDPLLLSNLGADVNLTCA